MLKGGFQMKKTISVFLSLLFIFALATPASALCINGSNFNIFSSKNSNCSSGNCAGTNLLSSNCSSVNCADTNLLSGNCKSGNCASGNFSYCLKNDGTACLTGYNGSCSNIKLPSCVNGCKVTSVGSCFSDNSNCNLNSVTVPNCVKSIGCNAFSDCTLKSNKGSCAEKYAKSDSCVDFKSVDNSCDPKLSKDSVCVKKGKTASVSIIGKKCGVDNKYTNSSCAKISSKCSSSKLTVKGLKKGNTTLKIKVNNCKTLKLKVKVK